MLHFEFATLVEKITQFADQVKIKLTLINNLSKVTREYAEKHLGQLKAPLFQHSLFQHSLTCHFYFKIK